MKLEDKDLRMKVHLAMLEKSRNAKDLGDFTVVPLGFAVDVAIELIKQGVLPTKEMK